MHCKDTILRTQNNWPYSKLIPNSGSLLSENSHVTDEQMQNAYKSFVEQITTISQSQQSYPEVFRMLNRTRIELDSLESSSLYELEKK